MEYIQYTNIFEMLISEKLGISSNINIYPVGRNIQAFILFIDTIAPTLIDKIGNKPINLFVTGSSGSILGGLLCKTIKNKITIHYISKNDEKRHGFDPNIYSISLGGNDAVNIILDDFVSEGKTVNKIYGKIKKIVKTVDFLILASFLNSEWDIDFQPTTLICDSTAELAVLNLKNKNLKEVIEGILQLN